jgi:hypothetical protein
MHELVTAGFIRVYTLNRKVVREEQGTSGGAASINASPVESPGPEIKNPSESKEIESRGAEATIHSGKADPQDDDGIASLETKGGEEVLKKA